MRDNGVILKEIPKTVRGLRVALFDEINGLRTGRTSVQRAVTIHKLATQIIELTKLEVNHVANLSNLRKNNPIALE